LLLFLFAMLLPSLGPTHERSPRVMCVFNLKQDAIGLIMWSSDHQDQYPMAVPQAAGGTKENTNGVDTYRHYLAISNVIQVPRTMVCPADKMRTVTTNFTQFNNQHLSYFIDLDANPKAPRMFLAGDRHLTSTNPPVSGVLNLSPGQKLGWTTQLHKAGVNGALTGGNVAFADGHVSFCHDTNVTEAFRASGDATNVWRLSLPE